MINNFTLLNIKNGIIELYLDDITNNRIDPTSRNSPIELTRKGIIGDVFESMFGALITIIDLAYPNIRGFSFIMSYNLMYYIINDYKEEIIESAKKGSNELLKLYNEFIRDIINKDFKAKGKCKTSIVVRDYLLRKNIAINDENYVQLCPGETIQINANNNNGKIESNLLIGPSFYNVIKNYNVTSLLSLIEPANFPVAISSKIGNNYYIFRNNFISDSIDKASRTIAGLIYNSLLSSKNTNGYNVFEQMKIDKFNNDFNDAASYIEQSAGISATSIRKAIIDDYMPSHGFTILEIKNVKETTNNSYEVIKLNGVIIGYDEEYGLTDYANSILVYSIISNNRSAKIAKFATGIRKLFDMIISGTIE